MVELKKISDKVLHKLKKINNKSGIAWVGGTATDYIRDVSPYDYDIAVYGVSYEKNVKIFSNVVSVWNKVPEAGIIRAWAPSGKKIDVFLATRNFYDDDLENWKWDLNYYNYLLKNNLSSTKVFQNVISSNVARFSNSSINVEFPSMKIISKNSFFNDYENNVCRVLRKESRYVFGDYMRLLKYVANGYKLDDRTKSIMVNKSLIPYLCWKDKLKDENTISIYQDIFLRNLKKLYNYRSKGKSFDPCTFYRYCINTSLFSSLFSDNFIKNPSDLSSKEGFLKSVYGRNLSKLAEDLGSKYVFEENFKIKS